MSITEKIPQEGLLYMRLLEQEQKFSICVIRNRYPKTKNYPSRSFSKIFVTGI